MKTISIVTPCFNEEGNVLGIYQAVKTIMSSLEGYQYEHIFIDNCSTDGTTEKLRSIANGDPRAKVILNARNFGPGRSGGYAIFQAKGDAIIGLACDFQDPPELIPDFVHKWEEGYKVVLGQKNKSEEAKLIYWARTVFYRFIRNISNSKRLDNVTGFGLYDRCVVDMLQWLDNPEPNFRGAIAELGYEVGLIQYTQPKRASGKSSYNLFRYADTAINDIVISSKSPLRLATYFGFGLSLLSFMLALMYLILKLVNWDSFKMGTAPILIGLFFFSSVQLAFIGVIGEYIGAILTRVTKRPLVIEKERMNFDKASGEGEDERDSGH